MRNKINFGRLSRTLVVVGILVLAASTSIFAQRETSGSFRIFSNDSVVGLVPGQMARVYIVNGIDPAINTARDQGEFDNLSLGAKPHVRVFGLNGNLQIAQLTSVAVDPGKVGTVDIKYADLEGLETDPQTGRREFRLELTIDFTGLESDARKIRPALKSLDGGKTWTIGMLLPAVQKVR